MIRLARQAMGTLFEVYLVGPDRDHLITAGEEALEAVEAVEQRLSHYRPSSELSDLNDRGFAGPVPLSPEMYRSLTQSHRWAEMSGGAFDPTVGALVRCWGFFRGAGRLPGDDEIRAALDVTGYRHLRLDADSRTAALERAGVLLHLGAVGKGCAIDEAVDVLRQAGVAAALIHGGTSSLYALGAPPGVDAWEVGLCDPADRAVRVGTIRLRDQAMSTSGNFEQHFELGERRPGHILDPRTGCATEGEHSATWIAPSAAETDALSTALFVLAVAGMDRLSPAAPRGAILVEGEPGRRRIHLRGEVKFTKWDAVRAFGENILGENANE